MSTAPVVFVDTETLGLDPDHNPIWEVGLILPDGSEHQWTVEVSPRDLALAHPKALEISRFEERYNPVEAVSRRDLAVDLYRLLPERCHLAGAVVSFDEERLRRLMWEQGLGPVWHYHLIDVETLAVGCLAEMRVPLSPPWDSDDLSIRLDLDPERFDRHTALGDARWANAIYDRVMAS